MSLTQGRNTQQMGMFLVLCCLLQADDLHCLPGTCQASSKFCPLSHHCSLQKPSHFTDEDVRAQKGEISSPGSHV